MFTKIINHLFYKKELIYVNENDWKTLVKKAHRIKILKLKFINFDISLYKDDFKKFTALKELDFHVDISYGPLMIEEIGQIASLKKLLFLNSEFEEFPQYILKLKNLEYLTLRGHAIQSFPSEIQQLTKLEILRIENCDVVELPKSLANLTNLKELHLIANYKFTELEPSHLPKNLKLLKLTPSPISKEKIDVLKKAFPTLVIT